MTLLIVHFFSMINLIAGFAQYVQHLLEIAKPVANLFIPQHLFLALILQISGQICGQASQADATLAKSRLLYL